MARIEQRLASLGLTLPPPMQSLPDVVLPFPWVRVFGDRAFVSGHGPAAPDAGRAPAIATVDTAVPATTAPDFNRNSRLDTGIETSHQPRSTALIFSRLKGALMAAVACR